MSLSDDDAGYIGDWERIAGEIWKGTFKGPIDPKMVKWLATKLSDAVIEGMGKPYEELEFNSPQKDMADHLLTNAYQFSVAKNRTDMEFLTQKLVDPETNKIRTWPEYKKIVSAVMDDSNKNKFRTEYNFAVAAAQNASRWSTFEKEANLKYLTANDGRVRDSHRVLHGLIYPKQDSFWNSHYPPNGWGCRCYAIETMEKVTSPDKSVPHVDIPAMFRVNLAKEKLMFPKDHVYYKGGDSTIAAIVTHAEDVGARDFAKTWSKNNIPKGKPLIIPVEGIEQFSELTMSRKDINIITGHYFPGSATAYRSLSNLNQVLKNAEYLGQKKDAEIINEKGKKVQKHPGVSLWHYYKVLINKIPRYYQVKHNSSGEFRLHCITSILDEDGLEK